MKGFDTEFRVHSVVLKLYSAYFRRFLDAVKKTKGDGEMYQYVTVIDSEVIWALEPASKVLTFSQAEEVQG